jgi:hypothetical protein
MLLNRNTVSGISNSYLHCFNKTTTGSYLDAINNSTLRNVTSDGLITSPPRLTRRSEKLINNFGYGM